MAKNDLVPTTASAFALVQNNVDIADILGTNLEGNGFNLSDLDAIRIPAGGGSAWTIPTLDGDEVAKSVSAVIVGVQSVRAWWKRNLDEPGAGNSPPDCSSPDARTGYGDPFQLGKSGYYACAECPNAQFGSAPRGSGQWCKEMRQVFIVRPDDALPIRLVLPPTSIKDFGRYLLRLSNNTRPYFSVVTRFTLEKTTNNSGIAYAKAAFERERDLTPEETAAFRAYAQSFSSFIKETKPTITTAQDYVYNAEV